MIYNIGLVWEHIISSVNYSDATPGLADEAQTRNFGLGRTTLYQLSYCQINIIKTHFFIYPTNWVIYKKDRIIRFELIT